MKLLTWRERVKLHHCSISCVVQPKEPLIDFTRFRKYGHLLRTVAWIRRFICNSKMKEEDRIDSPLTGLEIQDAAKWLIAHVQEESFTGEVTSLKQRGPLKNSNLANLNPFMCPTSGFLHVGQWTVKDTGDKVCICLFTCAVPRAVHLELVCNMTVERFLLALRRMIARRGMCSIIWSDNAKTFKAANKQLQQCWRVLESDQTQVTLSEKKIQWKFITECTPWWGGFYECLVKGVKTPLKKIFAKAMLDAKQLTTVLVEIEAQLNSHPLTYLGADPDDYNVITPAQILIGRNLQASPTKDTRASEHTSTAITKHFQYHRRLVNGFWRRWQAEYLKSLTPLKKWSCPVRYPSDCIWKSYPLSSAAATPV